MKKHNLLILPLICLCLNLIPAFICITALITSNTYTLFHIGILCINIIGIGINVFSIKEVISLKSSKKRGN